MPATMARKRKASADQPEKRGKGLPIGYRPSADVQAAMDDYRRTKVEGGRHDFRPEKTVIIEAALRKYFRSLGYDISEDIGDD